MFSQRSVPSHLMLRVLKPYCQDLVRLVSGLPMLEFLVLPNIINCGAQLFDQEAFMEDCKACVELVCRPLFDASSTLHDVSFSGDVGRWASVENCNRLTVERSADGRVERLLWLKMDYHVRCAIREQYARCSENGEGNQLWFEDYDDETRGLLELFNEE